MRKQLAMPAAMAMRISAVVSDLMAEIANHSSAIRNLGNAPNNLRNVQQHKHEYEEEGKRTRKSNAERHWRRRLYEVPPVSPRSSNGHDGRREEREA
jgi:hypothetical protein